MRTPATCSLSLTFSISLSANIITAWCIIYSDNIEHLSSLKLSHHVICPTDCIKQRLPEVIELASDDKACFRIQLIPHPPGLQRHK